MTGWWEDVRTALVVFRVLRRHPAGSVVSITERRLASENLANTVLTKLP